MKVAILGVGTVGTAVANILLKNKSIIKARSGKEIVPVIGVVKNTTKARDTSLPLTDDLEAVLAREDIDIYVELMGGVAQTHGIVKRILAKGKPVVTANKALLAYHRYDLQAVAGGVAIGFEASVAGGIPIIKALREGLSANHIESIQGIMNGTSNYILTKMMHEKVSFAAVLKEAQELGYAEADPTFDVGGFDAAHKLLILASIAYGVHGDPEDILIEGIERISQEDIYFAKEFDYTIKLLGIAKRRGSQVELRVHPALVPSEKMIAKVDGVMNGISVIGDAVGETMYYGPGAGGNATASAVISDLIDIARDGQGSPMLGFKQPLEEASLSLMPKDEIETKYYLRMHVRDEKGVLAKIATILGECNISIDSFLQKPDLTSRKDVTLLFATHTCKESDAKKAIEAITHLDFVSDIPHMIRIEE
ncbi:homoserine dehydrogenase [Sulfurospirillum sp. T05]|uniref:Homoserine dehydrogenase n=1 Tax=Sulfurospirillum tamanense TaxID=2813362 RepID=A0ABS2WQU0_9BACT|nr:homoserine dehydrogenase [Sulfurospirillum tamanensis]